MHCFIEGTLFAGYVYVRTTPNKRGRQTHSFFSYQTPCNKQLFARAAQITLFEHLRNYI